MLKSQNLVHFEVEPVKGEEEEKINNDVEFQEIPVECVCPYCKEEIVTLVELKNSWLSYIYALVIFLLIGWISCPVLPLIWTLLQDTVHSCPRCLNKITSHGRIKCGSMKSEVMSVRCGSCAVVLTKKYLLVIFVVFAIVIGLTILRILLRIYGLPDIERGPLIDNPWIVFLETCGVKSYLGNPIRAMKEFDNVYKHKTISWTGRVLKVEEGFWKKHFIYIGMNPPQIISRSSGPIPDLGFTFNEGLFPIVGNITVGDYIEFEATLVEFGKRGYPHFGQLWNLTKIENEMDLFDLSGRSRNMLFMIPILEMMNQITEQIKKRGNGTNDGVMKVIGGPEELLIIGGREDSNESSKYFELPPSNIDDTTIDNSEEAMDNIGKVNLDKKVEIFGITT